MAELWERSAHAFQQQGYRGAILEVRWMYFHL
jgi:hypothetical protein